MCIGHYLSIWAYTSIAGHGVRDTIWTVQSCIASSIWVPRQQGKSVTFLLSVHSSITKKRQREVHVDPAPLLQHALDIPIAQPGLYMNVYRVSMRTLDPAEFGSRAVLSVQKGLFWNWAPITYSVCDANLGARTLTGLLVEKISS